MRILYIVVALAVVFATTSAMAGARQHFLAGQDYYTQGRYQKAIEEFEEAYRLDPKPLLLFNLAQAYEKLGKLQQAVDHLNRYLEADPKTDQRQSLEAKIGNLKARIGNTGITIKANESGAAVYVDDSQVGTTPVEGVIQLSEGAHKVRISKQGFADFVMNIHVTVGQSVPIEATLEPGQAGPPVGAGNDPQVDTSTDLSQDPSTGADPSDTGGRSPALKIVPWVICGVGGAAAIVGLGIMGPIAVSKDDHDIAKMADIIGWPGIALFVAGGAWGVYNLVTDDSDEESPVAVMPVVDPHGAHLAATIRF